MSNSTSPLAATDADPYAYYAELVARRPFYYDDTLDLWVASGARAVEAVLSAASMCVRPPGAHVPAALRGTAPGDFFSRIVRTNDGAEHAAKPHISAAFSRLDAARIEHRAVVLARDLIERSDPCADPARLSTYAATLPMLVVATALGFDDASVARSVAPAGRLAAALRPGAEPQDIAAATDALDELRRCVRDAVTRGPVDSLARTFARDARSRGIGDATVEANLVAFFTQGYDATAGLIGNTLQALATGTGDAADTRDRAELREFVCEVARFDAPVHNTRRYCASDDVVMHERVRSGDEILVLLAAANRDPAANADPHRFDPHRIDRQTFTFGVGAHACPGGSFAVAIATGAVAALLKAGLRPEAIELDGYAPSLNARIPRFARRNARV